MSSSFTCNSVLYRIRPSLYPSLTDVENKIDIDQSLVLRILLPIACCFAAQLVLSNVALVHSSIAFLQMMKQMNVVLVYLFSLTLALEEFSWRRVSVLVFIVVATALTIRGELRFSAFGFTIQGISMLCESMKLTLQSYSLSSSGRRLDALTYVMIVSPLVFLVLVCFLLVVLITLPSRPEALSLPGWTVLQSHFWLLLGNAGLAFCMNIFHALFMKKSSAITFILTGVLLKDILIVLAGAIVLGDPISNMQIWGFGMQLVGITLWSMMKAAPAIATDTCLSQCYEPGAIRSLQADQWEELQSDLQDKEDSRHNLIQEHHENPAGLSTCHSLASDTSSESTRLPVDDWSPGRLTGPPRMRPI
jgi:drug/metabolite transporter (DMT)-like permease